MGEASTSDVAAVLDRLWGGPETLIVISSDLSHFLTYERARDVDSCTADAILNDQSVALYPGQACGARPINGLMKCVVRRGLRRLMLDLRNSGDTAGRRDRVVGYGAFAFTNPGSA